MSHSIRDARNCQGSVCLMQGHASMKIDEERCQTRKKCLARKACGVEAIVQFDPGEAPFFDLSHSFDCRLCIPACPFGAVSAQPAGVPIHEDL